jgi:hypothetical protein
LTGPLGFQFGIEPRVINLSKLPLLGWSLDHRASAITGKTQPDGWHWRFARARHIRIRALQGPCLSATRLCLTMCQSNERRWPRKRDGNAPSWGRGVSREIEFYNLDAIISVLPGGASALHNWNVPFFSSGYVVARCRRTLLGKPAVAQRQCGTSRAGHTNKTEKHLKRYAMACNERTL